MEKINQNIMLLTDSYKVSHYKQYPKGTEKIFSFWESRGGRYKDVILFGLQYFVKRYLEGQVVTDEKIKYAKDFYKDHLGNENLFNEKGWRYILEKHNGKLPVEIRAVREGSKIPISNVLMTVENTDEESFWLTNWLETILSQVWYPSTVATQSHEMREVIQGYLNETSDDTNVSFKLHDFGYRGVSSPETAGLGGAAHLLNFMGTDTVAGAELARVFYKENMVGFSIPAAEHSTITSWGKENESEAFANMLEKFPSGLVAVVSDSYNIYKACSELWGDKFKEQILNRDGTLIVRPDSGEPKEVVLKVLNILGEKFGAKKNSKGYKVLPPQLRVIQGDGIDHKSLPKILEVMKENGWAAENIAFGSGGGLLQKLNRDTQKFAFKASAAKVNGKWRDVMKDPVDTPWKKSKAGRLALIKENGKYKTVSREVSDKDNLLKPVFRNGELLNDQKFSEIRECVNKY